MDEQIRSVLTRHGRLAVPIDSVATDDDLYGLGLTSHASVNVMLALEDEFDVEFPDEVLTKTTFSSIDNITRVVDALVAAA